MRQSLLVLATAALPSLGWSVDVEDQYDESALAPCQNGGYSVTAKLEMPGLFKANLDLIEPGCAQYGPDVANLTITVEYQTKSRLHVLIEDRQGERFHVPELLFPRPSNSGDPAESDLVFDYTPSPFSFLVRRKSSSEVIFNTSGTDLLFKPQYLGLQTWLPSEPNLYGLGEHFESFRMPYKDYLRTFWGKDGGVYYDSNLYGSHPVYFEHRPAGTHGVLLLNSNGMDVKIDVDDEGRNFLQYNVIGGVLDFYFLSGPDPVDVSRQYAELAGLPAMVPYWSLGFHQCKSGYQDWFQVAEVISNYSDAGIPLETMWTDIDYYDRRRIFSYDPERFPLDKMRAITQYLHDHNQKYILMVDPAVANVEYTAYEKGAGMDVFFRSPQNASEYFRGVVWPGDTVFPDWLHPNTTRWWTDLFKEFFSPDDGIDIDGVWIDMNEPASFCKFPCSDPAAEAERRGMPPTPPPVREPPRNLPEFNVTASPNAAWTPPWVTKQRESEMGEIGMDELQSPDQKVLIDARSITHEYLGEYEEDLLNPPYKIHNRAGKLSDLTVFTDVKHFNGITQYDAHNLYGLMMGMATREAMLARQPTLRPFIISRSTFAGAGRHVQKWLGDNAARWTHYRSSIAGLLAFATVFQMPMVGSDVCGFNDIPSENLCARWATLGAFSPFYRNHATSRTPPQEFFLWPTVTSAAQYAISVRYRLLDYIYTALHRQSRDGTPAINPMWYLYPQDNNTYSIDLQYFYGDCIVVSPVTEEDSTDVRIYLPNDIFYGFETQEPVRGRGEYINVGNVPFDRIPLHVRGGCIVPLRMESANTTAELREKGFELLVAPGLDGKASGTLYVDDGVSLDGGKKKVNLRFEYVGDEVTIRKSKDYYNMKEGVDDVLDDGPSLKEIMTETGVRIEKVKIMGQEAVLKLVEGSGEVSMTWKQEEKKKGSEL